VTASWQPIHGFRSPGEYERFKQWIAERVSAGVAERVEVETAWADANTLLEEWYRHLDSGDVWRLVAPDPPSPGLFDRVDPARRKV
jgi:hypothetical protein